MATRILRNLYTDNYILLENSLVVLFILNNIILTYNIENTFSLKSTHKLSDDSVSPMQ